MSAEPAKKPSSPPGARTNRIECAVDNDPRLLASLGALLAHAAHRAGFPEGLLDNLAAGARAAREMARTDDAAAESKTRIVVEEFSDRLEMTIESTTAGAICRHLKDQAGERLRCEKRDGRVLLTLLKPCGAAQSEGPR